MSPGCILAGGFRVGPLSLKGQVATLRGLAMTGGRSPAQKRSVGAEIGRGSLGTKLGWPGARVHCYSPTPMGKLAFGMLSPT